MGFGHSPAWKEKRWCESGSMVLIPCLPILGSNKKGPVKIQVIRAKKEQIRKLFISKDLFERRSLAQDLTTVARCGMKGAPYAWMFHCWMQYSAKLLKASSH